MLFAKELRNKIPLFKSFWNRPLILMVILLCLKLCVPSQILASSEQANKPLKVGFIMGGPVTDLGWNQAHNEGRLYVEKSMNGKVQTIFAEKIPENAEAARVMEKMIAQGAKLIFATTYGYLDSVVYK